MTKTCMVCGHSFETADGEKVERCPHCGKKFVELVDGPPLMSNKAPTISERTKKTLGI